MIQEHGIVAFIKRTFKLNGYCSRSEMARDLCEKILDSEAYCMKCIDAIQSKVKHESEVAMTKKCRSLAAEEEHYQQELQKCQKAAASTGSRTGAVVGICVVLLFEFSQNRVLILGIGASP